MTKLEYLRNLRYIKVSDGTSVLNKPGLKENIYTWKCLGKNIIKPSTKIYNKDSIYLTEFPEPNNNNEYSLNGYLLYCNQEFIASKDTNFNWKNGIFYDYDFGEISFGNDIVSPYFTVLLTPEEITIADVREDEPKSNWLPYKGLNSTDNLIISEDDYSLCLKPVGYPFVTESELEFTRDEICRLAIKPALEEYFHWIPATIETSVDVKSLAGDCQEVDMPSEAYCVVGLSLQQYGSSTSGNVLSPLFYGMEQALYSGYNYTSLTGSYTGNKAKTQLSSMDSLLRSRASAQALINYGRRVHYEGPYKRANGSKYIKIYSNTQGTFNIWWGKKTLDFNDVNFAHRTRVIEYSQACVKELFGNLRGQVKSDIPGLIDYKEWIKDAETKKKEIREEYKKLTKAAGIIRGSL